MAVLRFGVLLGAASAFTGPKAGLPRSPARAAAASSPEMVVNVGVIGAGRIGLVHLEALSQCQDAKCVIISNPTVSKAENAAKQYYVPEWSGDSDDARLAAPRGADRAAVRARARPPVPRSCPLPRRSSTTQTWTPCGSARRRPSTRTRS